MSINLNNLNISLDQFNAVSSGKYNIGQLKLGEDGASVYRTNNHKTLTFLNGESISPEESFALKVTFCKALADEGLSSEDIKSVKEKLGIAGGAIDAVRAGGATPLSAADVRQIIDEYAEKINAKRAAKAGDAKTLQTSSEIYRGVGQSTLESRAAARESVNARTVGRMMSAADYSVNTLLDMLQFTGKDEAVTMFPAQKGIAREILKLGKMLSEDNPVELTTANITLSLSQKSTVVATFRLEDGNTFPVDTGLDRNALRRQMNVVVGNTQAGKAEESGNAEESGKAGEKPGATAEDGKKELLEELKRTFADAGSAQVMNKKAEDALHSVPTHNKKTNEPLGHDVRMTLARVKARESLKGIVGPLQKALSNARPRDVDNVKLVNQVRDVIAGNTEIDTDDLFNRIKAALDAKIVDSREKVAKEIASGKQDDIRKMKDEDIEPLNINAWLEQS